MIKYLEIKEDGKQIALIGVNETEYNNLTAIFQDYNDLVYQENSTRPLSWGILYSCNKCFDNETAADPDNERSEERINGKRN